MPHQEPLVDADALLALTRELRLLRERLDEAEVSDEQRQRWQHTLGAIAEGDRSAPVPAEDPGPDGAPSTLRGRPAVQEPLVAQRVLVHHMTRPHRLALIEEEGLRTRGELSGAFGELEELDSAARGKFAHGRRVSAWLDEQHALAQAEDLGAGHVTWEVDPRRALAAPASLREEADAAAYWEATPPLQDWLAEDDVPDDLEVHVDRAVRTKFLQLRAPKFPEGRLGDWQGLVDEVADEDRLSAKALMHLAVIESEADFTSTPFEAACALAWRDEPDPDGLIAELLEADPDKVASAALAMYAGSAPDVVARLRDVLDETRVWSDENGVEHGQGVLMRTAVVLDQLEP